MKQIIKNVLLMVMVTLVATMSMASASEDAPAMYFEPADGSGTCGETTAIDLMVNTSGTESGVQTYIHFDDTCVNITNVDFTGCPWPPSAGPGWGHYGDWISLAAMNGSGVEAGVHKIATITINCAGSENCTSELGLTNAEPVGVIVYNGTFTCNTTTGEKDGEVYAEISIGDGNGAVTIPIMVKNASNVGACDVRMVYNTSVVNVTNVSGVSMDNYEINDEHVGEGWIIVAGYQGNNPGLDGTFTLANVEFEPVGGVDSCQLEIIVRTFKDATPETVVMNYTVSNGTYYSLLNGDVNEDGDVDVADAMLIAKYVVGLSGYGDINEEAADVDGDGTIDIADAMYLAKYCVGIAGFEELR